MFRRNSARSFPTVRISIVGAGLAYLKSLGYSSLFTRDYPKNGLFTHYLKGPKSQPAPPYKYSPARLRFVLKKHF